jgi:hypothetical protein
MYVSGYLHALAATRALGPHLTGGWVAVWSVRKLWIREFLARVWQRVMSQRVTKRAAYTKTVSKLQLEPGYWQMEYCFVRVCSEHIDIIRLSRHVWKKNCVTDPVVFEHGRSNGGDFHPHHHPHLNKTELM